MSVSMGSGSEKQLATNARSRQLGGRLRDQRVASDRVDPGRASLPAARPDRARGPIFGNQYAQQTIRRALRSGQLELDLSDRVLTTLPAEIGQLTNLQRLDLHHNQLTALPAELGRLTNLQFLFVEGNPLEEPWASLAAAGSKALLAHLRSLAASTRSGDDTRREPGTP